MSLQDAALDAACGRVASGRMLARQLGSLVRCFGISEAQFRLLWLLREGSIRDQRQLTAELGLSPAQVSGLVEKLRVQGALVPSAAAGDRRRQLWQLTTSGTALLEEIAAHICDADTLHVLNPPQLGEAA